MKVGSISVLALLCMLSISVPQPVNGKPLGTDSCDGEPCLQIGSFNIEYLAGQRRRQRQPIPQRSKKTLKKLTKLIAKNIDLEIVVLQEIHTEGENWQRFSSRLVKRGYRFISGASSSRNQFVVIAYDADEVELLDGVGELDLPNHFVRPGTECDVDGQRRPVAARFKSGDFDFWLVGLHLKSKGTYGIPEDCPDWVRTQQTKNLLAEIERLAQQSGEADVILAGDFNAEFDESSLEPLRQAGFQSQMVPEFRRALSGEYSYPKRYPSVIDHVMFRPATTRGFVPKSGVIYPLDDADLDSFVGDMSDHLPVWSSFFTQKTQLETFP